LGSSSGRGLGGKTRLIAKATSNRFIHSQIAIMVAG
jgi:hypothetical protein